MAVSKIGTRQSPWPISNMISVHPRMILCAPRVDILFLMGVLATLAAARRFKNMTT